MANRLNDLYKLPHRREPISSPRTVVTNRKTAGPRKKVGFISDGKLHIVLDTNVIIDALKAKKDLQNASECGRASLLIINLFEREKISVGVNQELLWEYQQIKSSDLLNEQDLQMFMNQIQAKGFSCRTSVSKAHTAATYKDDHLFDCLSADVLISSDKGVSSKTVLSRQSSYKKISTPNDFVAEHPELLVD